jgi:lysophospholipase L1-like esterase
MRIFERACAAGLAILGMAGLPAMADDSQAALTAGGQHAINGWGFEKAEITDASLPRVLLIGDSIVGGYKAEVITLLQGKANVDVWTTPKHVGGPGLNDELQANLKNGPYTVIHFNESGLHAWQPGRIPDGQYGPFMQKYIEVMKAAAPQAKLIWASTTPVTVQGHPGQLDDLDKLISDRNAVCVPLMQANSITVDDLHALMLPHLDLALGDRWHWNPAGFDLLAKAVAASISGDLVK